MALSAGDPIGDATLITILTPIIIDKCYGSFSSLLHNC